MATHGRKSSSTDLDELKEKIGRSARYRSISDFYHVTKSKQNIKLIQFLIGSKALMTRPPSNQSPLHNTLKGVFFSCNLGRSGYELPDISPFGSDRVKIPIAEFADSKLRLFYNSHHHTRGAICYTVLVLVKESDTEYAYCRDHMIELDMKSNPFLKLDFERNSFQYCEPSGSTMWLELFMVGNINLTNINHSWDTVTETGRNQSSDFDDDCVIQ